MNRIVVAGLGLAMLAGCGVDGAPIKPQYTLTQTFGINSRTGGFSRTGLHVDLTQTAPVTTGTAAQPGDDENSY